MKVRLERFCLRGLRSMKCYSGGGEQNDKRKS